MRTLRHPSPRSISRYSWSPPHDWTSYRIKFRRNLASALHGCGRMLRRTSVIRHARWRFVPRARRCSRLWVSLILVIHPRRFLLPGRVRMQAQRIAHVVELAHVGGIEELLGYRVEGIRDIHQVVIHAVPLRRDVQAVEVAQALVLGEGLQGAA